MQKVNRCIFILLLFAQSLFGHQVNKVIVSGGGGSHDEDVKTAFLIGYASYDNTPYPGEIELYPYSFSLSFQYAIANNVELIIRSTTGLSSGIIYANNYPTVKLIMPSGANEYKQTFFGNVITCPVVITGAGIDTNVTAYKLEFFSIDPITGSNLSSFANGFIAGQLAFIANTLNCSFDSARALARQNGSEGGECDFYNGFGKIFTEQILAGALPVELASFTAKTVGKSVLLKWQTATEVNNYGFEIERKIVNPDINIKAGWETIEFVSGHGNSNTPQNYSFVDKYPQGAVEIYYRLKQIDNDGKFEYSEVIKVSLSVAEFELSQNYPNPFNPSTNISYKLPIAGYVNLKIYDVLGNEIETLVDEYKEAGNYSTSFNSSSGLASGVYIYKIEIKNNDMLYTMNRKMTLLK